MNHKTTISALVALAISASSAAQPAFAQGNSNHDRNDRGNSHGQRDRHDNRDFGRSHNDERRKGRGAGPNHEYYRGDRLPAEYRHRNYVVNDWRGHHLSAPPRGYQWVQSGSDYVLIAIATGIIAQLLLNQ